jgi:hypothetical protein
MLKIFFKYFCKYDKNGVKTNYDNNPLFFIKKMLSLLQK